jgi:hypothetical protein
MHRRARKRTVGRTSFQALGEVLDGEVLVLEGRAVLVVQPPKLLKDFGVTWVVGNDAFVGILGTDMLTDRITSEQS